MKNVITNIVSFAVGAVIGTVTGAVVMNAGHLLIPDLREMTDEMSKYFDQI